MHDAARLASVGGGLDAGLSAADIADLLGAPAAEVLRIANALASDSMQTTRGDKREGTGASPNGGGRHEVVSAKPAPAPGPAAPPTSRPRTAPEHRHYAGMGWTDERTEALPALLDHGYSASDIARILGGGLSRNAVIGKVTRLGMALSARGPARSAINARPTMPRARPAPRPRALPSPPRIKKEPPAPRPRPTVPEPTPLNLTLMQLTTKTCRYPLGAVLEPARFYCGHQPFGDTVYCEYHAALCHVPAGRVARLDRRLGLAS